MANKETLLFAKTAALKKSFESIREDMRGRCYGEYIQSLLAQYGKLISEFKKELPVSFSDIPESPIPISQIGGPSGPVFEYSTIKPLMNNLDYILELRANMRIGENLEAKEKQNRIFISHGRSSEWYKVQAHLEKDLNYETLELAQQPNTGRTILDLRENK